MNGASAATMSNHTSRFGISSSSSRPPVGSSIAEAIVMSASTIAQALEDNALNVVKPQLEVMHSLVETNTDRFSEP